MHGEEMITKLKMDDKNKNKPIIVLSASVDHDTQRRVEAMGISAFYVKTHVTPSELVKKVGEILKLLKSLFQPKKFACIKKYKTTLILN